ncbi:hydrolase, alpha beta domain protein [Companilactobacillus kimchiensis]|uniref:Hydrolase, alpha beta domain protein n=2 Tax=Companilactobacillus kimchiensis TaxID=993692 RepID=A0A0R2LBH7_9LACO|nr:hydrolase, alpha beta domain protein [Companilactobacillus kimchiensis]
MNFNDLDFNVRTAGLDNVGELIIFLHGFPESSLMWEPAMKEMSDLGYRCVAFDQRGYSKGARPQEIAAYSMTSLANDVVTLANKVGFYKKFHLVGHDMGSLVGWTVTTLYPDLIGSWNAISVPDLPAYEWALKNDPAQQQKGSYVQVFQQPGAAEAMLQKDDYAVLRKLWAGFDSETVTTYLDIFSDPGAITAVVNWYRALFQTPQIEYTPVTVPTMLIWGTKDLAIAPAGIEKNAQFVKADYQLKKLDAGHWLMEFNAAETTKLISDHVQENPINK